MTGIYLQPIGLLYGEVARDAVSVAPLCLWQAAH